MKSMSNTELGVPQGGSGVKFRPIANKHPPEMDRGGGFDAELTQTIKKKMVGPTQTDNPANLRSLAEEIAQTLSGFRSLSLSMNRDMKQVVVRVMDSKTNHVIRQIPAERMVDLVKQMRDLEGVLLKATA